MDNTEQSLRFLFWRKVFVNVIAIGLIYILFIRPFQAFIIDTIVSPIMEKQVGLNPDIRITAETDEVNIESNSEKFQRVKFELPFSGYFWLAISLVWSAKNKNIARTITYYNLVLFLISPILIWGIFSGFTWLAPIANVHEKVYKAIFLILGLLSVKEVDEQLKH